MRHSLQAIDSSGVRPWQGGEYTFGDFARILRRRRMTLLVTLAVTLALVTLYCCLATRRYQATGEIQIQKESSGAFGLESGVMGDAADAASDALDFNITLQTQASILQSSMLAQKVIEGLRLEPTADFFPPAVQAAGPWKLPQWLLFWEKPFEPLNVPLAHAPNRRDAAVKIFLSHLKVEPVTSTRLIDISYSNPDPVLAAAVVNRLITELTDYTFQARFAATAEASTWLAGQLSDLKGQTEELQSKAADLQRDTGIFGSDDSHNIVVARLEILSDALAGAEANRILKEATFRVAQSGDPELISGLSGNGAPGLPGPLSSSLTLIQSLRAQEATVEAELSQDVVRYGSNYPRIAELRSEIKGVDGSIAEEVHRVGERARTDYEIAARSETAARSAFEQQRTLANKLNDKAISFELAKQEADSSRDLYEGLLAKLKQAGILEGLRSTNITVVNSGQVPPSYKPKSPNLPLYYAAGTLAGLLLGLTLAAARELTDDHLHSVEEAEEILAATLLCVLPAAPALGTRGSTLLGIPRRRAGDRGLAPPAQQRTPFAEHASPFMESLRGLRTSLKLARSSEPPKVILVTSSIAGEGKSTVCLNLGFLLAQQGARVLLVEADLRRPVFGAAIGRPVETGLSTALASDAEVPVPVSVNGLPNLSILLSGPTAPFPSELLGSPRMCALLQQWRGEYDCILIDSPPVLPVTDAVVLAHNSDAVILVARHEYTARKALQRSYSLLRNQLPEEVVLGSILNGLSGKSSEYYGNYDYAVRDGAHARA